MVRFVCSETDLDVFRLSALALDHSTVAAFRRGRPGYLRPGRVLALDLSAVEFMDSAGLAELLALARAAAEKGSELKLVAPTPDTRSLFTLVRLHRVVDIYNDLDEVKCEVAQPMSSRR